MNYRQAYGIVASNGILFNHESPIRGETFVTRKITRAAAAISQGLQDVLWLGNLDAQRDWGHARDYVEGMWRMLQAPTPGDYVLATGKCHTVREMAKLAFAEVGIDLAWRGSGVDETGVDSASGEVLIRIDPRYFRPTEVDELRGDASKAERELGWRPTTSFAELIREMVKEDLKAVAAEAAYRSVDEDFSRSAIAVAAQ